MSEANVTTPKTPVAAVELEELALRVAQAASTAHVVANASEDENPAELHNCLALLSDYLCDCARDLSALHARMEARP